MRELRFLPVILFISLLVVTQTQAADLVETTARERVTLHAGPGHTFLPQGVLNPGVPVEVVERNATGNWIYVQRREGNQIAQAGWIMLGTTNIPPELQFSEVPVTDLPDADVNTVNSRSMQRLYSVPVIPQVSDKMVAVFEQGQTFERNPRAVTKVGDSLSADHNYLEIIAADERELGPFAYLSETVDYYSAGVTDGSVAAQVGLSSIVVFDPFWANNEVCETNETPLECEYRLSNPAVSFIMFGPNDVLSMNYEKYGENLRQLTEETLAMGVIPVLSTFSYHPDHPYWWQSVEFNKQVLDVAETYEVPMINLWAASRPLEQYGLDRDLIHMKQSGFPYLKYDTGHETYYGTSLRNLLAVRTLHEIRLTLGLELE